MNVLGISCYCHDSAAALVRDGVVSAACQEERLTRIKDTAAFPIVAVNECLRAADLTVNDVDYIVFHEKPLLKFARIILGHVRSFPFSLKSFLKTMPTWLEDRLILPFVLKREAGYEGKSVFIRHHLSHGAGAFLLSPFEEAAVFTADCAGEWASTTCGIGRGRSVTILRELHFPDSLGFLTRAVTDYLGFAEGGGEDAVMDLAGKGSPAYLETFRTLAAVKDDGSFRLDDHFFSFNRGGRLFSPRFARAFGAPRDPADGLESRHCDIAASLQAFVEETLLAMLRNLRKETGMDNLCLAGGLALNTVAVQRIREEAGFARVFVPPAAGDAGGALGAACYAYHTLLDNARSGAVVSPFLGPEPGGAEIRRTLVNHGLPVRESDDGELLPLAARLLHERKVVAFFHGRMEFAPRSFGNRCVLASPCEPGMRERLNRSVGSDAPFRSCEVLVTQEKAREYFDLPADAPPFTLLAPRLLAGRSDAIPAAALADGTARVHVVERAGSPRLWTLLQEFGRLSGAPALLHTSFALAGEPLVCSAADAARSFLAGGMDCLVAGSHLVERIPGSA